MVLVDRFSILCGPSGDGRKEAVTMADVMDAYLSLCEGASGVKGFALLNEYH